MDQKEKLFIIYDLRGIMDTDEALVLEACDTLKEAWQDLRQLFDNGCIYKYDILGNELINELLVGWRQDGTEWQY